MPSLAVVLAIVLALVAMGALSFFIHHIATTLQVSHLLERVGRDTIDAVDRCSRTTLGTKHHRTSVPKRPHDFGARRGSRYRRRAPATFRASMPTGS